MLLSLGEQSVSWGGLSGFVFLRAGLVVVVLVCIARSVELFESAGEVFDQEGEQPEDSHHHDREIGKKFPHALVLSQGHQRADAEVEAAEIERDYRAISGSF